MDIDEVIESPAFWILGGGAVAMEIIGFVISKRMGIGAFPVWQMILLMLGTLVAAAFFATKD